MKALDTKTTGELIDFHLKLRDRIKLREDQLKEELKPFREAKEAIEAELMDRASREGVDSFKGATGTAFLSSRTDGSVADRESLLEYVSQRDLWHLLKISVNGPAVREFMEETEEVVPGVSIRTTQTLNVRKPTKK